MASARTIYHIIPLTTKTKGRRVCRGWGIRLAGQVIREVQRKSDAVEDAAHMARGIQTQGGLAQVVVHTLAGRISFERTYGQDPRRYKG